GHLFITHYLNVPSETTFDFVANRWANPLWRSFDWVLLLAALWHGLVGLRYSVTDFIRRPGWRTVTFSMVFLVGIVWTALGTITIFTFDEAAALANEGPLADQMWIAEFLGASLFVFAIGTYLGIAALIVYVTRSLRAGVVPVYNGDVGQYAWVMHRATGVGTVFFLLVHIVDIMLIGLGAEIYDESVEFYGNPFLLPMEIALVGAVVYHTLNGLRILAIDFWEMGTRRERQLFWAALIGTVVLTLPSAVIILAHEL
ncbi:MAG TPA: succinate dehydrogenase, cytochrome b556 subunit, partial [Thermomicrobiales bacterium]|nr:succinate dehydrogenase, cytochrome b556 subunit [Thermomicrobiales bacterium]